MLKEEPYLPPLDYVFPGDPHFGIPILDLASDARAAPAPLLSYGYRTGKTRKFFAGTNGFYIPDSEFMALARKHPQNLLRACHVTCEVNFTMGPNTPFYRAVELIGSKRWLSVYWAKNGIKIIVDLYVPPEYTDLNLVGIPYGWTSYSVRSSSAHFETELPHFWNIAANHAGHNNILFLVWGGGRDVARYCSERGDLGYLWVPERIYLKRS